MSDERWQEEREAAAQVREGDRVHGTEISRLMELPDLAKVAKDEDELSRCQRRYDAVSREWDDIDAAWNFEWQKAGGVIKNIPTGIQSQWFSVGRRRAESAYHLKMAEYGAHLRSLMPIRHDEPNGHSPYYSPP